MSFGAEVGNLGRDLFSDFCLFLQSRFVPRAPPAGESRKPFQESWSRIDLGIPYPVVIIICVHYLGPPGHSTSQILGTFSRFSGTFLAEREGWGSLGDRPGP